MEKLNFSFHRLMYLGIVVCFVASTASALPAKVISQKSHLIGEINWPQPDPNINQFPHESTCHYYYLMLSEDEISLEKCPDGQLFDYVTHECSNKEDAKCWSRRFGKLTHDKIHHKHKKHFKCPYPWGKFPHLHDCTKYHLCMNGKSRLKKCAPFERFDKISRKCIAENIAVCADETDVVEHNYKCPKVWGSFTFRKDCSKYYECLDKKPNLRTCQIDKLFDEQERRCVPKEQVSCGSRHNPYEKEIGISPTVSVIVPEDRLTTLIATSDPKVISTTNGVIATENTASEDGKLVPQGTSIKTYNPLTPSETSEGTSNRIITDQVSAKASDEIVPGEISENKSHKMVTGEVSENASDKRVTGVIFETASDKIVSGEITENKSHKMVTGEISENKSHKMVTGEVSENASDKRVTGVIFETASDKIVSGEVSENKSHKMVTGEVSENASDKMASGEISEKKLDKMVTEVISEMSSEAMNDKSEKIKPTSEDDNLAGKSTISDNIINNLKTEKKERNQVDETANSKEFIEVSTERKEDQSEMSETTIGKIKHEETNGGAIINTENVVKSETQKVTENRQRTPILDSRLQCLIDSTCVTEKDGTVTRCTVANGLEPYPGDEKRFVECSDYKIKVYSCPGNLTFIPTLKKCKLKSKMI